jgi:hypothetical protein
MLQNVQFYLLNMFQHCSGVDYPGAMTGIYPKGAIVYIGICFQNDFQKSLFLPHKICNFYFCTFLLPDVAQHEHCRPLNIIKMGV